MDQAIEPLNTTHLRRVRRIFNVDTAPRHVRRHNQLAWVRAVRNLGDKWLLAQPVSKEGKTA